MTSDSELINKYKQRAIKNNTIQQTSFSSMSVNGTELKGGTNLISRQTQITYRNKQQVINFKSSVIFLLKKFEKDYAVTELYVGGHQSNPALIYKINPLIESLVTPSKQFQVGTDGIFNVSEHNFVLNSQVLISSIITDPLNTNTGIGGIYYVRDANQGTFKLSRTVGGKAVSVLYPCNGIVGIYSRLNPSFYTSTITKTLHSFKVHFITQPIEDHNALDFYVYSNGTIYKSRFTFPDSDLFNLPIISAIVAGDGSFSVRGTRTQIPQGVYTYSSESGYFDYGYRNDRLLDAHSQASNSVPYSGGQFPLSNPHYIPPVYSIMAQSKQALAYLGLPDGALGILIGVEINTMFYSTLSSSLLFNSNFLLPITPVKFIPFRQGFSVLIRPEENVINDIRFDNYPETDRLLKVDFLASSTSSYEEFKLLQIPNISLPIDPNSYVITEIVDKLLDLNSYQAFYIKLRLDNLNSDYYLWNKTEKKLDLLAIDPNTNQQILKIRLGSNLVHSKLYYFTVDSKDKSKGTVNISNLNSASNNEQNVNYFTIPEDSAFTTIDVAAFI